LHYQHPTTHGAGPPLLVNTVNPLVTQTSPTLAPAPTLPTSPRPRSAHLPAALDPHHVPRRAAHRRLQLQHHYHNVIDHYASQHTNWSLDLAPNTSKAAARLNKRKQAPSAAPPDAPMEAPPPLPKRRLHTTPGNEHTARLAPSPQQVQAINHTMGSITQPELFDILTETQSKYNKHIPSRGLMYPGRLAQLHPAGPDLAAYGTTGCPVDIQEDWTIEQLDAAVAYGAHPSAESPTAATALREESMEKVNQKFAQLIPWKKLRQLIVQGLHQNTKVSPIAAIPHKSRLFRMILDLSSKGQRRNKTKSVNELTNEAAAPSHSMDELGNVLGRFIYLLATADPTGPPMLFCKLDIKDGFWRMCVPQADELQFCYVLPQLPTDDPNSDIMIVVPAALQMGWTSSPAFFCAATETGRDIADFLRTQPTLPPHPLEHHMVDPIDPKLLHLPIVHDQLTTSAGAAAFQSLFEVYVDDYCALLQSSDPDIIRHHSRALLHAIHQVFPPPSATGHAGEEPISLKKLVTEGEGVWDARKEILGWIFDGIQRTMELPERKVESLRTTVQLLLRQRRMPLSDYESFLGKCQHACLAIPGGKALLAPMYRILHAARSNNQQHITIHPRSPQALALTDLRTMFKIIGSRPTYCAQLAPADPDYIGHCDACKYGCGGVWFSGLKTLRPIVWRFPWPAPVLACIDSGKLSINDLEMAGLVLHYLILESIVDMRHTHTAAWCDNTSAVSWTVRMSSRNSAVGQQLTRALALRTLITESSPLAALSIAGKDNPLADLASRSFKATGVAGNYSLTDLEFLTRFTSDFPLTQHASWLLLRPNTNRTSLVCSLLLGETVPTGSWLRLTKSGCDIGHTGSTSAPTSVVWTPFSETSPLQTKLHSCSALPDMYVKGLQAGDIKSASAQFRTRYAPSARPSNWTSAQTPPTKTA
jgi:hypothetical protein